MFLWNMIVGESPHISDLWYVDPDLAQQLRSFELEDVDEIGLTFSVTVQDSEGVRDVGLVPGGKEIAVTNENKIYFLALQAYFKLAAQFEADRDAVVRGFHDVVPLSLLQSAPFTAGELEQLVCGRPVIDVANWKAHTEYKYGYHSRSPQVLWFWDYVLSLSDDDRRKLLFFATGTSSPPVTGFQHLCNGRREIRLFTIQKSDKSFRHLPVAHTCYNTLELPEYLTQKNLFQRLSTALEFAPQGFGIM
jgi:E3 ubiquitin-protein ligase HUWE1